MRDKALFAAISIGLSFVLFGMTALLKAAHYYTPQSAGFVLAAAAVMIAARGVAWKRKALFALLTLGIFTLYDLLILLTGLRDVSSSSLAGTPTGPVVAVIGLLGAIVPLVLPLAMIAIFVDNDPSVLWTAAAAHRSKNAHH
jgi:hypothetical protein